MSYAVGFTGTQKGMTADQEASVARLLLRFARLIEHRPAYFCHGACTGADEQALVLAESLGYVTAAHPGPDRERETEIVSAIRVKPEPFLDRNRAIVESSDVLIATPEQATEVLRSGTWATVRYARQADMTVYIVQPDGRIDREFTKHQPGRIVNREIVTGIDPRKEQLQ